MDEYASCYFCGAAVDRPVREYPVVPDEVDTGVDTGETVALCPVCRGKLDALLDPVLAAFDRTAVEATTGRFSAGADPGGAGTSTPAEDPAAPPGVEGSDRPTSVDRDAGAGSDTNGIEDDPDGIDGEGPGVEPEDDGEAGAAAGSDDPEGEAVATENEPDAADADPTPDAEPPPADPDGDATPDDADPVTDDADAGPSPVTDDGTIFSRIEGGDAGGDDVDEDAAGADDGGDRSGESIGNAATFESNGDGAGDVNDGGEGELDDGGADASPEPDDGEVESDQGQDDGRIEAATGAEDAGDPAADGDREVAADVDDRGGEATPDDATGAEEGEIPVDAYNKIVRLLQNREFPVERAEIEEVATSAYDIPPADCERALDALVDREVLSEDGGRLVREDERRRR